MSPQDINEPFLTLIKSFAKINGQIFDFRDIPIYFLIINFFFKNSGCPNYLFFRDIF